MKKPKDLSDLTVRLSHAATTPLVAPAPPPVQTVVAPEPEAELPIPEGQEDAKPGKVIRKGKTAARQSRAEREIVPVYLRVPKEVFGKYDAEAMRRTKATGRGVTAQKVILDLLEKAGPNA